jgi:hypothetical protein
MMEAVSYEIFSTYTGLHGVKSQKTPICFAGNAEIN